MNSTEADLESLPRHHTLLFDLVNSYNVFEDDKIFIDLIPKDSYDDLKDDYTKTTFSSTTDVKQFIEKHFDKPDLENPVNPDISETDIEAHIQEMWKYLSQASRDTEQTTELSVPKPYVKPGGRFTEMYYWDSYFTSLGLVEHNRIEDVENMVENFAFLIDRYGFVPNGTRQYYLSRSQPPFFYKLLHLLEQEKGFSAIMEYIPQVIAEHEYWMETEETLPNKKVVMNTEEYVLNRYWDTKTTPRMEMRKTDMALEPKDNPKTFHKNRRASCESGWDFSSRWRTDPLDPSTNNTTSLAPVDLNSYLYEMEKKLSEWLTEMTQFDLANEYKELSKKRKNAINTFCWNDDKEFYVDYNWKTQTPNTQLTLAGVVPLFTGVAIDEKASSVATTIENDFLEEGGVPTTLIETGEQWDYPNGWAPLQLMTSVGLRKYGYTDLAKEIETRWCTAVEVQFEHTNQLFEKYNVQNPTDIPSPGEYDTQAGFGWTNGVYMYFKNNP